MTITIRRFNNTTRSSANIKCLITMRASAKNYRGFRVLVTDGTFCVWMLSGREASSTGSTRSPGTSGPFSTTHPETADPKLETAQPLIWCDQLLNGQHVHIYVNFQGFEPNKPTAILFLLLLLRSTSQAFY